MASDSYFYTEQLSATQSKYYSVLHVTYCLSLKLICVIHYLLSKYSILHIRFFSIYCLMYYSTYY